MALEAQHDALGRRRVHRASALARIGRLARRLVAYEIGIWCSLFLLVTRRVSGRGPGVQTFSYSRDLAPLIAAFIVVSMVELPVVHLLLPWETVRIVALVISVWGLLWMVGLFASAKVFPHLLDADGLRIRYGASTDIRVPWEAVASVASQRRHVPTRRYVHLDGAVLSVPVLKQTRVDVALEAPMTIGTEEITEVRLYATIPGLSSRRRASG